MSLTHSAVLAAAVPIKEPKEWILYLPAGEHEISCLVDGKPKTIKAKTTKAAAAALQRDLESVSETRRPFIDFDHEGKRAAGWIKAFRWSEAGVEAQVEWTAEGRAAVTGGSMRYFSPEWRIDLKTGECMGLLPVRPAGGLVNLPAFESMASVAAKLAVPTPNTFPAAAGRNTKPKNTMSEQIKDACVKAGLITEEESAADNAAELVTNRLSALKGAESNAAAAAAVAAQTEVDQARAQAAAAAKEVEELRKANAAAVVAANAHKLPPQNKEVVEFWTAQLAQPGEAGVKAKAALEAMPSALPKPSASVTAGQSSPTDADEKRNAQIGARASAIAREKSVPFSTAWAAAEKELGNE